jgi:calcineurin-like phosphoesterase family protein/2'-5' RNA ligase
MASIISKVAKEFRFSSRRAPRIPHLTLYGSFQTESKNISKIVGILENIGKKYDSLSFVIDGFQHMRGEKGKVVYFKVVPSKELEDLRRKLIGKLESIAPSGKPWDKKKIDFVPHITLCFRLSEKEANNVWLYLKEPPKNHPEYKPLGGFYLPLESLRLTFLGNDSRIICEYDMAQKKILSRTEALDKDVWMETMSRYRVRKGFETREKTRSKKPKIFLISDLHLDHDNIIKYCTRPFVNHNEMNNIIVDNWNNTVGPNDTVYFLGDMSFGRNSRGAVYWTKKLNGNIIFVPGNHDIGFEKSKKYHILKHGKMNFLLVHDPNKLPIEWDDWVIHGDKHNNDLRKYPFVNWEKKTVNVSLEVIGYKPMDFEDILKSIRKKKNIMDFI